MPEKVKKLVLCPECETELDINATEECPSCELNVKKVLDRDRYERALAKVRENRDKEADPKKKKGGKEYDPFQA